jgi:hypothetical protein
MNASLEGHGDTERKTTCRGHVRWTGVKVWRNGTEQSLGLSEAAWMLIAEYTQPLNRVQCHGPKTIYACSTGWQDSVHCPV